MVHANNTDVPKTLFMQYPREHAPLRAKLNYRERERGKVEDNGHNGGFFCRRQVTEAIWFQDRRVRGNECTISPRREKVKSKGSYISFSLMSQKEYIMDVRLNSTLIPNFFTLKQYLVKVTGSQCN